MKLQALHGLFLFFLGSFFFLSFFGSLLFDCRRRRFAFWPPLSASFEAILGVILVSQSLLYKAKKENTQLQATVKTVSLRGITAPHTVVPFYTSVHVCWVTNIERENALFFRWKKLSGFFSLTLFRRNSWV